MVTCDWWVNSEKQVAHFAVDGIWTKALYELLFALTTL